MGFSTILCEDGLFCIINITNGTVEWETLTMNPIVDHTWRVSTVILCMVIVRPVMSGRVACVVGNRVIVILVNGARIFCKYKCEYLV